MLIRSLRAEGFLKFRKLRIENFPRRGLIGIIGPNESGKSTIGQLFQFAIFGTTHHVVRGSIIDLIHWEDDHCVVELDIEHDGEGYRIWREMDRLGTSFARLMRISSSSGAPGEEIASGIIQVQREVQRRFHLGAGETLQSFYLAERESVTNPEQFRAFLDRVAGIDVLHGARGDASDALDLLEKDFTSVQDEIRKNDVHISRLQPNIDKIPELEIDLGDRDNKVEEARSRVRDLQRQVELEQKKRDEVQKIQNELRSLDSMESGEALRKCNGLIGLLQSDLMPEALRNQESVSDPLRDGLEKFASSFKIRSLLGTRVEEARDSLEARVEGDQDGSIEVDLQQQKNIIAEASAALKKYRALAVLVFLAGLGGIVLGIDHQYQWGLGEYVPLLEGFTEEPRIGFLVAAAGAAFFVIACWLASRASTAKQAGLDADGIVSRLRMELEVGKSSLEAARAHLALSSGGLDPGDEVGECQVSAVQNILDVLRKSRRDLHGEMGDKPGEHLSRSLKSPLDRVRATLKERRKNLDDSNDSVKRLRSKRDRIQSEIREYQNQDGRRRALEEFSNGLRKKSLEIREEMDIHRLLVELLEETIESVRMRAGPSLGKGLCRLLPHLTGGRYRDAQVTPEFEIRLFTGEKSDFLQAHELSGGTLQGLSFGFRLAFAQAFVRAVTEAPQFLFLDEPFPAMDRMRVLRTLQALPRLSQELSQVFVAHPDLDSDARDSFDLLIETEVGVDHIDMDLASFGISQVPEPMTDPPLRKRRTPAPPPSPAVETSSTDRPIFGSEEAPAREVVKPNPAAIEPPQEPAPPPPPPVAPPEPPATELPLDSDDWTIPGA
ncbi:MAG: AAA family ATPase [Planctomycetota bacterium]|nr:AAA family ATPase [Planctomycetota bacterium]